MGGGAKKLRSSDLKSTVENLFCKVGQKSVQKRRVLTKKLEYDFYLQRF